MRIHAVRTCNLNSLHGNQELDLDRDLARHALFLIRGDTGAGKSTILDAISLALFARTARLDGGSRTRDAVGERDPALVMSDGTARAQAEVDFSVLDGGTRRFWRARWSVARAHGRADGNLKRPERTLVRLDAERKEVETLVSSDKEKDTNAPFDAALCGLTWEDFSRTVILSQGQFQLFLRSSPKERAELLERLTATAEYAEIGIRAAQRRQLVDARVAAFETRIGAIVVTDDAEMADLNAEQARLESEERDLDRREADLRRDLDWLRALATIEAEVKRAEGGREEAAAAFAAFAEARGRLALHRTSAPAAAPLGAWRAAWTTARARATEAAAATDRLLLVRNHESTLAKDRERLLQALNRAEQEARASDPLVAAARAAWAARDHEQKKRDDATARRGAQAAELEGAARRFATSAADRDERRAALAAVEDSLLALEGTDALVPSLPQWRGWLAAWQEAEQRAGAARAAIDRKAAKQSQGAVILADRERLAADAVDRQARAADLVRDAKAALEAVTGGADSHSLRDELHRTRTLLDGRRGAIDRVIPLRRQESSLADRAADVSGRLAKSRSRRDRLVERLDVEQAAVAGHATDRDRLQAAREQLLLVLEIVARRGALAAGDPCPLCGSLAHPYRDGAAVPPSTSHLEASQAEVEGLLTNSADALRIGSDALGGTTSELAACSTGIDDLTARQGELAVEIVQLRDELAAARAEASASGLALAEHARVDELDSVRAGLLGELASVDRTLESLQAARDAVATARQAEAGAAVAVATTTKDAELTRAEAKAAADRVEHLAGESARGTADALVHERLLREALGRHRWIPLPVEGALCSAADAISVAEDRLRGWQELRDRHRHFDGELREQEPIVESDRAAEQILARGLSTLDDEVRLLEKAVGAAEQAVAEILDGQDPDTVAAELAAAVVAARCTLAECDREALEARIDLEGAVTAEGAAAREAVESAEQEGAASHALAAALAAVGLADVAALEGAMLPADEVLRLVDEEQAVDVGLRMAEGGVEAARVQLEACLGTRPATLAADAAPEGLLETHAAVATRRRDVVSRLGEILTTLLRAAEEAGKLRTAKQELAQGRREADRWKLIDDLIGTADGSRFRRLAQGYHLMELADFANLRLGKLSDRYRLRVPLGENGMPTMDFLVQDSHHAERERPLTTLSGGETFLVSLSLALALADFRAVRMPIETVLIDEGFGTLDPMTLNTVVQALENLQTSTGARVGIISHVNGLADRIGGRVLVERIAAGRSQIVVEHPA